MAQMFFNEAVDFDAANRVISRTAEVQSTNDAPQRSAPRVEIEVGDQDRDANAELASALEALLTKTEIEVDLFVFREDEEDAPAAPVLDPATSSETDADDPEATYTVQETAPETEPETPAPAPEPPQDSEWAVSQMMDGRDLVSPDGRVLQAAKGNRDGGEDLLGTWRSETLTGTDGDDVIAGLTGNDVLSGGAGSDVFVFAQLGEGQNRITDFDASEDTLYWDAEILFDLTDLTISQQGDDTLIEWHNGTSSVILDGIEAALLTSDHLLLG